MELKNKYYPIVEKFTNKEDIDVVSNLMMN
jgi:hypothetical protein